MSTLEEQLKEIESEEKSHILNNNNQTEDSSILTKKLE